MAYNDFTLEQLNQTFGISIQSHQDLFSTQKQPIELNPTFKEYLDYSTPLALSISTEKARSEMIIAPILIELKRMVGDRISLFSGTHAMIAAHIFNQKKANSIDTVYGAVTTGYQWKFLKLHQNIAYIDVKDFYIDRLEDIISILLIMVANQRQLIVNH